MIDKRLLKIASNTRFYGLKNKCFNAKSKNNPFGEWDSGEEYLKLILNFNSVNELAESLSSSDKTIQKKAFIFKIVNIKEPYVQELAEINTKVELDLKKYKVQSILEENADQFLIQNQFKSHADFKNYANLNKLQLLSSENIKKE